MSSGDSLLLLGRGGAVAVCPCRPASGRREGGGSSSCCPAVKHRPEPLSALSRVLPLLLPLLLLQRSPRMSERGRNLDLSRTHPGIQRPLLLLLFLLLCHCSIRRLVLLLEAERQPVRLRSKPLLW